MNIKNRSIKSIIVSSVLAVSVAIIPGLSIADNDRHKTKDRDFSSEKHRSHKTDRAHNASHQKYMTKHIDHVYGHKIHHKSKYRKHHRHNKHKHTLRKHYRNDHRYGHNHYYVVKNHHQRKHNHYYDPRLTVGLQLGHFDILFRD